MSLFSLLKRLSWGTRFRRIYIFTLLTLTTVTWTCVVSTLLLLGVLPPFENPQGCHGNNITCISQTVTPYSPTREHVLSSTSIKQVTSSMKSVFTEENEELKVILRWTRFYGKSWSMPEGRAVFKNLNCPESRCILKDDKTSVKESDAILVHMRDIKDASQLPNYRSSNQRWVAYMLESPYHTEVNLTKFNGLFNWTSTYSSQSDIPSPYGNYHPFSSHLRWEYNKTDSSGGRTKKTMKHKFDIMRKYPGKTRFAAWFVTNCKAKNNRKGYVEALQNDIPVDVYGICGHFKCYERSMCLDMLRRKYKFYTAFENSNCREYITEKFWFNALENDIVPIVMGAPKRDYERLAPPHSFIHVDDFPSVHDLARYLRVLQRDTRLYNEYFRWKSQGSATTHINLHPHKSAFWCDLCAALHDPSRPPKTHWNLDKWWSTANQCSTR